MLPIVPIAIAVVGYLGIKSYRKTGHIPFLGGNKPAELPSYVQPATAVKFKQQLADAGLKMATVKHIAGLRVYSPVQGDRPSALMMRFGHNPDNNLVWQAVNPQNLALLTTPGRLVNIPAGLADSGPRTQAMGTVK